MRYRVEMVGGFLHKLVVTVEAVDEQAADNTALNLWHTHAADIIAGRNPQLPARTVVVEHDLMGCMAEDVCTKVESVQ